MESIPIILSRLDERIKALKELREEDQRRVAADFAKAEKISDDKDAIASVELTRRLDLLNHENERVDAFANSCLTVVEYKTEHKALENRVEVLERHDNIRHGRELLSGVILPTIISVVAGGLVSWIITLLQHLSK